MKQSGDRKFSRLVGILAGAIIVSAFIIAWALLTAAGVW